MNHFCTIASGSHLPFVQGLFSSLRKQENEVMLHVLVTDESYTNPNTEGLIFYSVNQLSAEALVGRTVHQYLHNNNYLRWTLKPVFLHYLLQSVDRLIYVDNDIFFFAPFNFLFEQLGSHSILLTPHWFCQQPYPNTENFDTNFQIGLFNAGFIGASQRGIAFLKWWAEACLYRMQRAEADGFYDDQRYLDMALLVDENVGIVRHLGCNIGSWNMHQNKRIWVNNEVRINRTYPVVFIHFNHETIRHILNGNDALLRPYYNQYEETITFYNASLDNFIPTLEQWKKQTLAQAFLRKTKIRTRIKSWLFQLSQKL